MEGGRGGFGVWFLDFGLGWVFGFVFVLGFGLILDLCFGFVLDSFWGVGRTGVLGREGGGGGWGEEVSGDGDEWRVEYWGAGEGVWVGFSYGIGLGGGWVS